MDVLEFLLLNNIFGRRTVNINIQHEEKQEENYPKVVECTDDDYKLCYGKCSTLFYCDDNLFKLSFVEDLDTTDYAEINFEDVLFMRTYKNDTDTIYYSTDHKEWKKLNTEWYYSRDGKYMQFSNSIMDLFNEACEVVL